MSNLFARVMPRIRTDVLCIAAVAVTATVTTSCDVSDIQIPPFGLLTITVDTQPDDAQDFTFATTGKDLPGFTLDDDGVEGEHPKLVAYALEPGQYTVTENPVAGWQTPDVSCVNTNGKLSTFTESGTGVTVNMVDGSTVTCTFANVRNAAAPASTAASSH